MVDGALAWVEVGAHASLGKVDHDLIQLAAWRADVVRLDHLCEIDDAHAVFDFDRVDFKKGEDQVQR